MIKTTHICLILFLSVYSFSLAETITISQYDVYHANLSGTGGWAHTYNGTITSSGSYYNYTGGSGTLNDNIIPTGASNTQLFYAPDVSITLYLGISAHVSMIELLSFSGGNSIPGNITGLDVVINGVRQTYTTTGFGGLSSDGTPVNEQITLGSIQSNLITSAIILDRFTYTEGVFCIGEVVVTGTQGVPEPNSIALLGIILMGTLLIRKK